MGKCECFLFFCCLFVEYIETLLNYKASHVCCDAARSSLIHPRGPFFFSNKHVVGKGAENQIRWQNKWDRAGARRPHVSEQCNDVPLAKCHVLITIKFS
uniref:Putative secreted protein n=1 Tax=Anopheles triannulatus TaxID=58253 RepID=A0A2M4B0J4_9DIPT